MALRAAGGVVAIGVLGFAAAQLSGARAIAQPSPDDAATADAPPVDAGAADSTTADATVVDAPTALVVVTPAPERPVVPVPVLGWRAYLEGYLANSPYQPGPENRTATFGRLSSGVLIARYAAGGAWALRVRLGVVGYVSNYRLFDRSESGWGGELGLDLTISPLLRLGVLYAVTADHSASNSVGDTVTPILMTIGPRLYVGPHLTVGIDVFNFSEVGTNWPREGVLLGVGLLP